MKRYALTFVFLILSLGPLSLSFSSPFPFLLVYQICAQQEKQLSDVTRERDAQAKALAKAQKEAKESTAAAARERERADSLEAMLADLSRKKDAELAEKERLAKGLAAETSRLNELVQRITQDSQAMKEDREKLLAQTVEKAEDV